MTIELVLCDSPDALAELEPAWRELQDAGGVSHPMYSWEWMSTWWETFGDDGRILFAFVGRDDAVRFIAPFVRRRALLNGLFPYRRLELLGTGEPEADEVFSEYVDLPVRPGCETEAVAEIAEAWPAVDTGLPWDDIVVHRVEPDSVALRTLKAVASSRGLQVTEAVGGGCPYVDLPPSFDEYQKVLSGKRRYQIRKSIRDLEERGELSFQLASTLEEARETLRILARLHQARWQQKGELGVFASSRFTEFHRKFMEKTFPLGWPELWTLRVGGEPVACLYNIRYRGRVCHYQSGFRIEPGSQVQPGYVASYLAIKAAIESGAEEYDFMLGEANYKTRMANATRKLVTVRACRPSVKESLRQAARGAVRRARSVVRRRERAIG